MHGSEGSKCARIGAVVKASLRVSKACCTLAVQAKPGLEMSRAARASERVERTMSRVERDS